LLRGDTKSRYEAHNMALQGGWMNRNEVRAMENLNPVEGLDEFLQPLNMGGDDESDDAGSTGEPSDEPENLLRALNAKEVTAVRVEHGRLSGDEFSAWTCEFYQRLADGLIADGVEAEVAEAWAESRKAQLLAAEDVPALLDQWEK